MYKLLSFTIENFRSFCSKQTISFDEDNSLSATAIFGSNASGKSNIIKAISTFVSCIRDSSDANWQLPYEPFLLKAGMDKRPTSFFIVFLFDGIRYKYGFSFLPDQIVCESLYEESAQTGRMHKVFERSNGKLNSRARRSGFGKRLFNRTRDETLLTTKGHVDNNKYSNILFGLLKNITIISPHDNSLSLMFVDLLKNNSELRKKTLKLLRDCDFSIRDIKFSDATLSSDFFEQLPFQLHPKLKESIIKKGSTSFTTVHALRDEDRSIVGYHELDFWNQESMGTQQFFQVAVPIIDALEKGKTIFIDKYGSFIHPTLSSAILSLFKDNNKNRAHLVFTSHDTSLLESLKRGEVFLVEKSHAEESLLVSLSSLGARENEPFEKRYLSGIYGAIPIIER